jgi:GcrA cell cycle regulator
MPQPSDWTEARVKILRALWADGWTGAQIGKKFGKSRSAILGKIHRLGLMRKTRPPPPPQPATTAPSVAKPITKPKVLPNTMAVTLAPRIVPRPRVVVSTAPPLVGMRMLPLLELEANWCRWPEDGDPQVKGISFLFCGSDAVVGEPYCSHHLHRSRSGPR